MCTITSARRHADETHSTLQFANRAKSIATRPVVNEVLDDKAMLRRCMREISDLKSAIETAADAEELERAREENQALSRQMQELQKEKLAKLQKITAYIINGGPSTPARRRPAASMAAGTRVDALALEVSAAGRGVTHARKTTTRRLKPTGDGRSTLSLID